ncbi:MAG: hypothetical protein CVU11_15065 [Bacteroidetes bacterium HGW-Bacteroidetes-6]|jgi:predicted esterase|nr:MAG: hypothetical protein CVU11_15065 [Bacteroidetes bacterium HGW-Bacteroidetes-6]
MKHILTSVSVILYAIILLTSCSSDSGSNFSHIKKNRWYAGQISNNERLFISFQANNLVSGSGICFFDNGKALVNTGTFSADKNGLEINIANKKNQYDGSWEIDSLYANLNTKKETIAFVLQPDYFIPKLAKRYVEPIFDSVIRSEVKYSQAAGFYSSKPVKDMNSGSYPTIITDVLNSIANNLFTEDLDLKMDIYEPRNDTLQARPLLFLIHGGAFIVGDKRDDFQVKLANHYAKMGYVVASINYRMGYLFLPGAYSNLERCIYKAVQDSRAAIRWLKKNRKKYCIDPNYIFVAGNSAGGFIALKTAFMNNSEAYQSTKGNFFMLQDDLGCLDCSGDYPKEKFKIRGVISMWGALTDIDMLDKDEKTPLLLIHGDSDRIVPYSYNYPFRNLDEKLTAFFMNKVYGSQKIYERAIEFGFPAKLITFSNGSHEPQVDDNNKYTPQMEVITHAVDSFMLNLIGRDSIDFSGKTTIHTNTQTAKYSFNNFKSGSTVYWSVEGGCIVESNENKGIANVVWFNNSQKHTIKAAIVAKNGKVQYSKIIEISID